MIINKTLNNLRNKIKYYKKYSNKIEELLLQDPSSWNKFQKDFNEEINDVFIEILDFSNKHLEHNPDKVKKLKSIFIKHFRSCFLKGFYNKWSFTKPFGYSGDFQIIEYIYQNQPISIGIERLFDNYFLDSSISKAVRNRKNDFKNLIINFIKTNKDQNSIRIMNLASGPARELYEVINSYPISSNIIFECVDNDENSLNYAKNLLINSKNVEFRKVNALRIASSRNIKRIFDKEYDLIYSTGLFDYLNHKISTKIIANLRSVLKTNGCLAISDVRERVQNPSVYYMEWVGEWNLLYNSDLSFQNDFLDAGFDKSQLQFYYENQKIFQYIIASNNKVNKSIKF